MKKWMMRAVCLMLAGILLAGLAFPAFASEQAATEAQEQPVISISTVEELQAIAENPSGNYVLAEDLDMTGVEWKPVDFSGTFDGAGHAILNLTISGLGDATAEVHDGKRNVYESSFTGMFGTLKNATVKSLKLLNVRGVIETDNPCFMGGLAGYIWDSTISGCTVEGVLELRAHNQIFGLGGVVGYGCGEINNCNIKVTLITVDTDMETMDEQFLGGAYASGFIDVTNNQIKITGRVTEYGSTHIGGIMGLYIRKPFDTKRVGNIVKNNVKGDIMFCEASNGGQEYCNAYIGEKQVQGYVLLDNRRNFQSKKIRKYEQELRPCMCENPDIREYTVYSVCEKGRYGYTNWECWFCSYMENYNYTLITHNVSNWELVEAPTYEKEGLSVGICDDCGKEQRRTEPMLIPEETEPEYTKPAQPAEPSEEEIEKQERVSGIIGILSVVLGIAVLLLVAVGGYLAYDLLKKRKVQE